jgi:hypothetical protein
MANLPRPTRGSQQRDGIGRKGRFDSDAVIGAGHRESDLEDAHVRCPTRAHRDCDARKERPRSIATQAKVNLANADRIALLATL